ncbi:recombinase family protein [Paenibacillus sp. XY044]|uniref:recombinase family protein n=1 Tax=Paenibacillus sp. XY044 TaxID=2026089 RepID=UPI000B999192|nr:recombinase family protein [Paenibacillus sp. XY044]OZB90043.1 recombinase family protein [Paenibacillus sp. XY044]
MIGIYGRVSTEEQARSGFSIDFQIREGKKKAGTDEVKIYMDEGISGEFLERPDLNRLRQDVKDGIITKIIVLDPDRLARKLMLQLIITDEFERRGVELVFINGDYAKTPEGQLFYSMRGAIAEFEKAKINERMTRGRREKAKQGKVIKGSPIYGYNFDKQNYEYVINDDEARVVQLIFNLFTRPNDIARGINGIAVYLTDNQIPTKRGGKVWHKQVVRQILMNETYTGRFAQNKWNTEGMLGNKHKPKGEKVKMKLRPESEWIYVDCPQIISKLQFEQAQKLLGESRRRFAKDSLRQYLLSGLVRCGECHNTMTGRRSKNWGKYILEYSDVKNTSGAKFKGCGMKVKCEDLDNAVWEKVHEWLSQPEEIAAASLEESQDTFADKEIARIERDLEKTRAARKRLIKLFSSDIGMGEDEIREELRELADKEEHLKAQLEQLTSELDEMQQMESSRNLLQETLEYYLTLNPDELTFEDKQNLIRRVVKEVRVFNNEEVNIITF